MTHPNGSVPEALRSLGLRADPDALAAFFAHATKSRLSPIQTVEQLVALERREREVRNLAQRTRLATLGKFKPIDQFDWNHPRKIDRARYEQLLDGAFIENTVNVLFRGQSGVGKTTLAPKPRPLRAPAGLPRPLHHPRPGAGRSQQARLARRLRAPPAHLHQAHAVTDR